MKHVFVYIIGGVLCIGIGHTGCKTKRALEKNEDVRARHERVEASSDSIRTGQKSSELTENKRDETESAFTRITDYDSTGNIRRVSEEWRDRQSSDLVVRDRQGESVSINGSKKQTIERDTISATIKETNQIQADSRPIQGVEWLWVILAGALVLTVVIYVVLNKYKK